MALIEAVNVTLTRRGRTIINDVSLRLRAGEFLGLLGKNGAGKSTLLRLLCGLAKPSRGAIRVLGKSLGSAKDLAGLLGVVHQHTALPELIKVRELLELESRARRLNSEDAAALLKVAAMEPFLEEMLGRLSPGTQRKVAIIKALLHRPRILLLDEPTAGLDPVARRDLWEYLRQRKQDAQGAVIVTNDLEEARALCDRILVLKDGRIVARAGADATPGALASLLAAMGEERREQDPGVQV